VETNQQIKTVIDDPTVAPIFITNVVGIAIEHASFITLTLGDVRHVPVDIGPNPNARHEIYVSTRLSMSIHTAADIAKNLTEALAQLRALMNPKPQSTAQN
jgi:hypothetical protein